MHKRLCLAGTLAVSMMTGACAQFETSRGVADTGRAITDSWRQFNRSAGRHVDAFSGRGGAGSLDLRELSVGDHQPVRYGDPGQLLRGVRRRCHDFGRRCQAR